MSRDEEAKNPRLFDTRTVDRNIRKGLITRKDYEKHLKGLSDAAEKIAPAEAPRAQAPAPIEAVAPSDLDDESDTEEVSLDDPAIEEVTDDDTDDVPTRS
jgi:hypothetical protein